MNNIPEGYVKIEEVRPATSQTFEVVLLDGRVFPLNENEYLTEINQYGTVGGYCYTLEDFQSYHVGKNLVVVTGHLYKYNQYHKPVTGEVIPKEAILHFRNKTTGGRV